MWEKNSGLTRGKLFIKNPFQYLLSPFYLFQIHIQIVVVILSNDGDRLTYSLPKVRRVEE